MSLVKNLTRPLVKSLVRPITEFEPTAFSGNVLWLDASDDNTITDSGGLVSNWADKSGNSNDATASGAGRPTTGAATINGRNIISGNGSSNFMSLTSNITLGTQWSIFVVTTPTSDTDDYIFGSTVNSGAGPSFITGFAGKSYEFFGASPRFTFSTSATGINIMSLTQEDTVATSGMFNGTEIYNTLMGSFSGGTINTIFASGSGGNFAAIDMAEIIIYNRALITEEITQINTYLSNKWAIILS